MSNNALEHAESIGHAGGHSSHGPSSNARKFGVTMALIAVLVAFCAAMVGGERNDMMRSMIQQAQAQSLYSGASTKYRIVMTNIEQLRYSASNDAPAKRYLQLYTDYEAERKLTKNIADTYQPLIDAHLAGNEKYERAQLIAEIAIVVASLAVLLASNAAWLLSVAMAIVCLGSLGTTFVSTRDAVHAAEAAVEHANTAYAELRKAHTGDTADADAIESLDPGGRIRATIGSGDKGMAKSSDPAPAHDTKK